MTPESRPGGWGKLFVPVGTQEMRVIELCRHDTQNMKEQDNHVHALVTPSGRSAIFTAHRAGQRCVYEVEV